MYCKFKLKYVELENKLNICMKHLHLLVCKLIPLRKQLCHDTSFRENFLLPNKEN